MLQQDWCCGVSTVYICQRCGKKVDSVLSPPQWRKTQAGTASWPGNVCPTCCRAEDDQLETKQTHSPGAMRAVLAISSQMGRGKSDEELADIISYETADILLLNALEAALNLMHGYMDVVHLEVTAADLRAVSARYELALRRMDAAIRVVRKAGLL